MNFYYYYFYNPYSGKDTPGIPAEFPEGRGGGIFSLAKQHGNETAAHDEEFSQDWDGIVVGWGGFGYFAGQGKDDFTHFFEGGGPGMKPTDPVGMGRAGGEDAEVGFGGLVVGEDPLATLGSIGIDGGAAAVVFDGRRRLVSVTDAAGWVGMSDGPLAAAGPAFVGGGAATAVWEAGVGGEVDVAAWGVGVGFGVTLAGTAVFFEGGAFGGHDG